jgi:hypothetical protein
MHGRAMPDGDIPLGSYSGVHWQAPQTQPGIPMAGLFLQHRLEKRMDRISIFFIKAQLILMLMLLVSSCSSQGGDTGDTEIPSISAERILIVYLTRTRNTKAIAEIIHAKVGGALVELELLNPYPEDYQETVAQVARGK